MKVAIIMGSSSDLKVMQGAIDALNEFDIPHTVKVISAHRTPEAMIEFAQKALDNGFQGIIAGAGGAAHLPGMVASATTLPVIGVPVKSSNSLDGWDSLLSIAQMPKGVPVATMAVNGAYNGGLFMVKILATGNSQLQEKLKNYKDSLKEKVDQMNKDLI